MPNFEYSHQFCNELESIAQDERLFSRHAPVRYEKDHVLEIDIVTVHPTYGGKATLKISKFLGGGFAGQVYRAQLLALELAPQKTVTGLDVGKEYAIKIIVPPSRFAQKFRNFIYWLGFQGAFSSQVNYSACRSGLLLQKLIRRASSIVFGTEYAAKDAYASFWDPVLRSYGEITEWVEGRQWRLEADAKFYRRCKTEDPADVNSEEYVSKRKYMAAMVQMLHEMGAPEFARQYEWWTMKSQPNCMFRTDLPKHAAENTATLCAIDFRAGLALLPFLPMSPGDFKLIWDGLVKRRTFVQFDRCDLTKLKEYIDSHNAEFADLAPVYDELASEEVAYRRSLPDITHQGWKLITDKDLRRDVRNGLANSYLVQELVDSNFCRRLQSSSILFVLFYMLGALPFLGKFLRKIWGNSEYRTHWGQIFSSRTYFKLALKCRTAAALVQWHREGRISEQRARRMLDHPFIFHLERYTLGLNPFPFLHRVITEPSLIAKFIFGWFWFIKNFYVDAAFRERWFIQIIEKGYEDGMLDDHEKEEILDRIKDPFIVKYLKCVAVHFATLPVTQVVSIIVGLTVAVWLWATQRATWAEATGVFGAVVVLFQVIPISPGSICRGSFVLYLMIKERNWRDYLIAAPLSFVKYIGYLAFPLQMTTTYPDLARFLASRWATSAVHYVPIFGEKGALLEHWTFDLFFNVPLMLTEWIKPRVKMLLTFWLLLGSAATALLFYTLDIPLFGKNGINLMLAVICIFILPRVLFLPLLSRSKVTGKVAESVQET